MKQVINKLLAVVLCALAIVMLYSIVLGGHTARANNGDVDLIQRSGIGNTPTPVLMSGTGVNGGYSVVGFVSGTLGNYSTLPPVALTGSATVASELGLTTLPAGIPALSSSGTLVVSTGTLQGFH